MSLESRLAALITSLGSDKISTDAAIAERTNRAYGGMEKVGIPSVSSGVLTINAANGSYQVAPSITANVTGWVWQNLPVSGGCCFTLFIPMGSTLRTISTAIGGTVHWFGLPPTHVINKYTCYTLITMDQGGNWFVSAEVES